MKKITSWLKNQKKKGFSLIELSVVVLIIGIIIAAIIGGKKMITLTNLSKARALTNSSPVNGIEGLALWLEPTSKNSFNTNQVDGNLISLWNDINPQLTYKKNAIQNTTSSQPVYKENGINGLPALQFSGGDDYLEAVKPGAYTGSVLTAFVVAKRASYYIDAALVSLKDRVPKAMIIIRILQHNWAGMIIHILQFIEMALVVITLHLLGIMFLLLYLLNSMVQIKQLILMESHKLQLVIAEILALTVI